MKLGCVVMAAGRASRFGENKLLAVLDGKTLVERALDAVPDGRFERVCVVSQGGEIASLAEKYGFISVINDRPELGASRTVALGLDTLGGVDGAMFLVSDQPMLGRESVSRLLDLFESDPARIAALASKGVRGNPCVFPSRFFAELRALEGDRGGSAVIKNHPEALVTLEVPREELMDVDYKRDLENMV